MAVASVLPLALAVREVDACEDTSVESESMAFVNDEVVVVGLQPDRGPALFDGPSSWSVRNRDAADADFGESGATADQDVAAPDHGRLHNAVGVPRVIPEPRAVGRSDADRPLTVQQEDLRDAVNRRELW